MIVIYLSVIATDIIPSLIRDKLSSQVKGLHSLDYHFHVEGLYIKEICVKGGDSTRQCLANLSSNVLGLFMAQEYYYDSKAQNVRSCLMMIELFRWTCAYASWYSARGMWQDQRVDRNICPDPDLDRCCPPVVVMLVAHIAFSLVDNVAGPRPVVAGLKYLSGREHMCLLFSAVSSMLVAVFLAVTVLFAIIMVIVLGFRGWLP